MINYLKADNYCSLVNFKIDFSSINLLLGKNGTGKSTVISLIAFLRSFILGKVDSSVAFGFQTLTRWQSVPLQSFEFSLTHKDSVYIYQLEVEFDVKEKKNRVKKEIVLCDNNLLFKAENGKAVLYDDSYKEGPEVLVNWLFSGISSVSEYSEFKKLYDFKQAVEKIVVCHPLPFDYDFSFAFAEHQSPDYSAGNITNVYMYIVQRNPEKMMELWQVLKEINPYFVRTYLNGDNGIWLVRRSYGATTIATPPKTDCGLTYSEIISQGGMNECA